MKKILFVDDEKKVLDGLRRMLRPMRSEWTMSFAECGETAMETLASEEFDVVVSDMRMPGIDGAELLTRVKDQFPQIVRIMLTGEAAKLSVMKSVGVAHQFLSKPCDADLLKSTIHRVCSLRTYLDNESLKRLISQTKSLPSPPKLYKEIVEELQHVDASSKRIGDIVAQDAGMSAKVLQLVNSAFFGLAREMTNPMHAVNFLGVETIKHLALSVHVFSHLGAAQAERFQIDALWMHSVNTGGLCKKIVLLEGKGSIADEAMIAGLMHDLGKLLLITSVPEQYEHALQLAEKEHMPAWKAERQVIGSTHAEMGAYLLGLWGIPNPVVEAVAFHHEPSRSGTDAFTPLTAAHVANALLHEADGDGQGPENPACRLDQEFLARVGVLDRVDAWRNLVQKEIPGGANDVREGSLC